MGVPELGIPRETSETVSVPREVADGRTFTEGETYALVADNVKRETAAIQAEKADLETIVTTLEAEKAALQNEVDVAVAAREKAEKDLEDYKAGQVRDAEIAALKEARVAKVRDVAKHLKDDFFTDERAGRWAAMDQSGFDVYVSELAAVSEGVKPVEGTPKAETAGLGSPMSGAPVEGKTSKDFYDLLGRS
jgi:hypothetical protein